MNVQYFDGVSVVAVGAPDKIEGGRVRQGVFPYPIIYRQVVLLNIGQALYLRRHGLIHGLAVGDYG